MLTAYIQKWDKAENISIAFAGNYFSLCDIVLKTKLTTWWASFNGRELAADDRAVLPAVFSCPIVRRITCEEGRGSMNSLS